MKAVIALMFAATCIASRAVAGVGPSASQLSLALGAYQSLSVGPAVRHVRCQGFDEEPTEFVCRWLQQSSSGPWKVWSTHLAVDGNGFHLTDNPSQPSKPGVGSPENKTLPEDAQFRRWLVEYLSHRSSDKDDNAIYGYALADLNGDGRNDAIVWVRDRGYCGSGGCFLDVFVGGKSGWRRLSSTPITRPPIMLLRTSSHGWRDLAAWEAGGGIGHPFEARLRFNGRNYVVQWPADWTGPKAPPHLDGRVLIVGAALALFPSKCHRVEEVPSVFGPVPVTSRKRGNC